MRNAGALAVASWLIIVTVAHAESQPATLSDELLHLWNKEYDVEYALDPAAPTAELAVDEQFESEPRVRGTAGDGSSMTPNLDRLLRPHTPFVAGGATGRNAVAPRGSIGSTTFKGGSEPTTAGRRRDDDDRRWCRSPCRHWPRCRYEPPPPPPPDDCDPPAPVPEPASLLLFGATAAAAAGVRRHRARRGKPMA